MEECLNDYQYFFKDDLLEGKVALITGGGSGIGFTIAEVLMRHGCNTAIASRNSDRLKKAAEKLMYATGKRCIPVQMDVRNPSEVISAVDQVICELKTINILVNGAAGNFLCPAGSLSFNAFKTVIAIDTLGTFNVTKAVYEKSMKKHGGTIINLSATLHYTGTLWQAHAGSAKAAIDALTRHLAVEWGPGIRINSIAPGSVSDTEGFERLAVGGESEVLKKAIMATIPLKRFATKEDIANAALYLASEASSYVTGTCLVVDGGLWMTQGSLYQLQLDSKL